MSGILAVLTKAAAFILIIVMGYVLKRKGFFHPDDALIMKISKKASATDSRA